jgi:hypothetical protein
MRNDFHWVDSAIARMGVGRLVFAQQYEAVGRRNGLAVATRCDFLLVEIRGRPIMPL